LVESLENILQGLNENQTLLTLDISGNDLDEDLSTFKFKITNETLQKLNLTNISCFFFNNIFFSNLDLLRNLVSIPSLENFYIRENHLGRLGVEILCNKLKQDSNLKTLSFNGN
jgi:Ran GTPase-activating protein (RanGAP) involved in mRNA processing and transport